MFPQLSPAGQQSYNYAISLIYNINFGHGNGTVGKISAFRLQGPQFNPSSAEI